MKSTANPAPLAAPRLPLLMAVDGPRAGDTVQGGAALEGFGWAMSGTSLREVRVEIAGRQVCRAGLEIERPDLAAAFPAYADARLAGFSFQAGIDAELRGTVEVRVTAVAADGRELSRVIPIEVEPDREAKSAITCHLDEATLTGAGELYVFGWALPTDGIDRIAILIDAVEVCAAVRHLERSDIAELMPTIADAGRSGFGVRTQVPGRFGGAHMLTVVIHDGDGTNRMLTRVLEVTPVEPAAQPSPTDTAPAAVAAEAVAAAAEDRVKIAIDLPVVPADGSLVRVSGSLVLQGWAIARSGVRHVEAAVDGHSVGIAYYGVRREDVAAVYSDWPGAAHCGFGIAVPAKALRAGEHTVTLIVRDAAGLALRRELRVEVEATESCSVHDNVRTLMSGAEVALDREILGSLRCEPEFDLVVMVPPTSDAVPLARATLQSLENQEYGRWRATVAFADESDRAGLEGPLLDEFGRIAANVKFAGADFAWSQLRADAWVSVLYAGDRLGCDALLEASICGGLDPNADFIYSDDRRTDPTTQQPAAMFKPAWSPELMLATNYVGRAWFARSALVARSAPPWEAGGPLWRDGGYRLALRLSEDAAAVTRLPKLLFDFSGSWTADLLEDVRALQDEVRRRGIPADVVAAGAPGVHRLRRAVTRPGLVTIVIPTRGSRGLVRECISSIRRTSTHEAYEIVCVENIPAGDRALKSWLEEHADRVIPLDEPFNWSRFNNVAAATASPASEYLLFLNDDIEAVEPGWLCALLEHAQRDEVGVVGPQLLYPDRRIQHAGMFMVELGRARHAFRFAEAGEMGPFGLARAQRDVLSVTGACMLVRRSVFKELGGFDEAHRIVNNDLDFCLRCHARDRQVIYTPHARLVHHEMASRSSNEDEYDVAHFRQTWGAVYADGDPYYSRRLSRETDAYAVNAEPVQCVFGGHPLVDPDSVRSILALKLDHIGDFVTALPALRRIKERFPAAKLSLMSGAATLRLAALAPCVDEFIEFNFFHARSSRGPVDLSDADLARLKERLAPHQFDLAIDLRKHPDTRAVLRHVGAKRTAGYDHQGRYPWLDIAIEWDGDMPLRAKREHVCDDLLRLVDAVATACAPDRRVIDPEVSAAWEQKPVPTLPSARLFRKPVVCIHAASGNPVRQWPVGHFAQLVARLVAAFDVNVVLIGGLDEEPAIRSIWDQTGRHAAVYPIAGVLPLRHLPHLLSRCVLFVGNNSGPQHIAAGLGVPTIGIHSGVVDAAEWAPVGRLAVALRRDMSCSPCYLSVPGDCRRDVACLKELRPADVFEICRRFLVMRGVAYTAGS